MEIESIMTKAAVLVWRGFSGLPDFSLISDEDFKPAFEQALQEAEEELESIAMVQEPPTLENFCNLLSFLAKRLIVYVQYFSCVQVRIVIH